jgi:TolB-like protein/Tfp pilus assembly protein PilF
MSPEQARGKDIDQRTDVWSLGICLYEMLSGRQPFTGETSSDILASILTKELDPLDGNLPADLQRIIKKALQKDADKRYQMAKDLLIDLENVKEELKFQSKLERSAPPHRKNAETQILNAATTDVFHTTSSAEYLVSELKQHKKGLAVGLILLLFTTVGLGYWFLTSRNLSTKSQIESIAVMPFVNESGDSDTEYLSDGMTESLINSLSQLPKLAVKARSSVFRYKGKTAEPRQIGNELSVQAILNGRVVQRGDNITLGLELVDVLTGNQIWGEQYTRKLTDVATLQSEIARDVSNKLQAKLSITDEKRAAKNYTENTEAYQLYLKGRYHWNKRTAVDLPKSADYFQQAIEKDPNYALAYAALAEAYILIPNYTSELPRNAYPKAREAAIKALQMDETLAEGHNALATIKHSYDWDFVGAEKEFKRAIELNPNYATAHHWYGEFLLDMGRIEEGTFEIRRAQELDPLSLIINAIVGITYMIKGEDDLAIEQYKKTLEMDSNFPRAYAYLAKSYENKRLFDEAITAQQKYFLLNGTPPDVVEKEIAEWRNSLKANGEEGYWRKYIEILEKSPSAPAFTTIATLYIQIGEKEKAFSLLDEAYRKREVEILQIKKDPAWKSMLSDPRFIELEKRIGLPNG